MRVSENKELKTPSEYFRNVKSKKHVMTEEDLNKSLQEAMGLREKYKKAGQTLAMRKLDTYMTNLEKEYQLLDIGVTQYVYREDVKEFVNVIEKDVVKIIDLPHYERELPDEVVELVANTREYFTEFFVVFTDYTGEAERTVKKERRDKDPILFGAFMSDDIASERLYFLGDWIDEYCDLTFEKMIAIGKARGIGDISNEIEIPLTRTELLKELGVIVRDEKDKYVLKPKKGVTLRERFSRLNRKIKFPR